MYHSWLHKKQLEEDGPSPIETAVLEDFLGGKLFPNEAATIITNSRLQEHGIQYIEWVFRGLWDWLLDAAQQLSSTQDQLVHLVVAIKHLPNPEPIHTSSGDYEFVWTNLLYLEQLMHYLWNYVDYPLAAQSLFVQRQEWRNLNAFVGRLVTAHCDDYLKFGLLTIRVALEYDHQKLSSSPVAIAPAPGESVSAPVPALDAWVPAAAQWILHAGPTVYKSQLETESSAGSGDLFGRGKLWNGQHDFCQERWSFWKDRFGWVQGNLDLEFEMKTRRTAGEALAAMNRIDQSQ